MSRKTNCLIWDTPAIEEFRSFHDVAQFDSDRAGGRYQITDDAEQELKQASLQDRLKLTTWLLDQRRAGIKIPKILSETVLEAKSRGRLRFSTQIDRITVFIRQRAPRYGDTVTFRNSNDALTYLALAECELQDFDELTNFLKLIETQTLVGLMEITGSLTVWFSYPGYLKAEALLTKPNQDIAQCFVAMWFDPSLEEAFVKGMEPAIRSVGYDGVRIDRKEHNNKIDDEIIAEIRRSRFLVADFTSKPDNARGGVYFEAGFAFGLGLPVIYTCREDVFKHVHFDTRQYNHIVWTDPADLKKKLAARIAATVGDGPLKK